MKKNLLFLHGGPGFKDYLRPYFLPLGQEYNCVFYDQLQGPQILIDDLITQLHQIVENLPRPNTLLGHSWGGVLAVAYLAQFPQHVDGLVLISTGLSTSHWYDEYNKEKQRLGLDGASMEEIFLTEDERELGRPIFVEGEKSFSAETFDRIDATFLKNYDLMSALANITVPILNIFGEKDVRFPPRVTKSFKLVNPAIVDLEIKGTGHFPFLKESGRQRIFQAIKQLIG